MKIVAIVDEGGAAEAHYRAHFRRVREAAQADGILVLMSGDVARTGSLAARDKHARAAALLAAGAALVVETPLPAVLLGDNQYVFALAVMLQKLGCVDEIALPCTGADEAVFARTAEFLFDEPPAYQKRMRALRATGVNLTEALPEVAGDFVDGARDFLRIPMNRMAVEFCNTLRRSYSAVKPRRIWVDDAPREEQPCAGADRRLLERVERAFMGRPRAEAVAWASGMFSGSERTALRVLDALSSGGDGGFQAFSRRVADADMGDAALRRHLLACLMEYRKVDSFVCITYNYVPYIRVLGCADGRALDALLQRAGTDVLADSAEREGAVRLNDDYKRLLLQMDGRARALYEECAREK